MFFFLLISSAISIFNLFSIHCFDNTNSASTVELAKDYSKHPYICFMKTTSLYYFILSSLIFIYIGGISI